MVAAGRRAFARELFSGFKTGGGKFFDTSDTGSVSAIEASHHTRPLSADAPRARAGEAEMIAAHFRQVLPMGLKLFRDNNSSRRTGTGLAQKKL